jgi:hypothetical protein
VDYIIQGCLFGKITTVEGETVTFTAEQYQKFIFDTINRVDGSPLQRTDTTLHAPILYDAFRTVSENKEDEIVEGQVKQLSNNDEDDDEETAPME